MTSLRKKQLLRIALFAGTIISLYFVPWTVLRAWIRPLPGSVQEQADEAISLGFDGIIVYVDQSGKPPEFYAAGWHDRKKKIPADPHAYFKIASISKLYDAVAITKLVGSGRLSLEKSLADYFPELDGRIQYADEITLRMLLQHRSGIPNFTDSPGFWMNPPENSQQALGFVLDQPARFKPGESYEYSNTNYLLISELIEKEVGYDKFRFIREEILLPLGLKHTFGSMNEVDPSKVMSGYYVGVEEDVKAGDYGSKLTSMIATAEDVGRFLRALNDGSVFSTGEQEIYSSVYVYQHTGLIPGYQSIARYHPGPDAVVIQFTNTTDFEGNTWSLSEIVYGRIIRILKQDLD